MLDIGLLVSMFVILCVLYAAARWAPVGSMASNETVDRLYLPAFAGVLGGRVVAAALDDPTSLRSLRALLVLRGGVEFWPGVAVGVLALVVGLRRAGAPVMLDLVELTPFVLWGYGAWELTCFLRDGCFGPPVPFGLVPDGLSHPQFPVGLVQGAAVVGLGFLVRHLWSAGPVQRLLVAVAGLAAIRAVGSFWLPHLGSGLTRQHWQSLAVAVLAGASLAITSRRSIARTPADDPDEVPTAPEVRPALEQIRPHRVFRSGPAGRPRVRERDDP